MDRERIRGCLAALALVAAVTVLTGCAAIAEKVATRLADDSLKRQGELTLIQGDIALYRSCLKNRGGACKGDVATALPSAAAPTEPVAPVRSALGPKTTSALSDLPADDPANSAARVLSHPVLASAVDLHNTIRGHDTSSSRTTSQAGDASRQNTIEMDLSIDRVKDFMDQVQSTTANGAWSALTRRTGALLAKSSPGDPDRASLESDHRRATYVKKYLEAYFENGHFIAVDFKIGASEAQQDLARQLTDHSKIACQIFNAEKASPPSSDCSGLAKSLYESLRGSDNSVDSQVIKIPKTGFIPRDGGKPASFPGFDVNVDPLASHLLSITTGSGSAVDRIDFTTIGSQIARVVLEAVFDAHEGLPAVNNATGRQLGAQSLPLFNPTQGNVDTADFSRMTTLNDRVVVATGVVLDRIIQGIGPLSLDNRALETLIVTLVTTSVRKAVEKATWCWYSCNLDVEEKKLEQQAEADGKSFVQREEQRLKLALRIRP